MLAQLFESFRKVSETSLQAQQDIFKQWVQQWPTVSLKPTPATGEWSGAMQQRWLEATKEAMEKHRELLDSSYRAGIDVIQQTFRAGDAKSPEEYRSVVEDLWRRLSDTFKSQSEAQFREFQSAMENWFEAARRGPAARDEERERGYQRAEPARA